MTQKKYQELFDRILELTKGRLLVCSDEILAVLKEVNEK